MFSGSPEMHPWYYFEIQDKKSLIEKNLQMEVFAVLLTLLQGLTDFEETL